MSEGRAVFQLAKLPAPSSRSSQLKAKQLWDFVLWCMDCRKERDEIVRDCDRAFLCHRFVPDTGTIELLEDGPYGESDLFDYVNKLSARQADTLMPPGKRWLVPASREGEAEKLINAIADQQIQMYRQARLRRNWQRFKKQQNVRGRSGLYWKWHEEVVYTPLDLGDNAAELERFLQRNGMDSAEGRKFVRGRYPHVTYAGPVIKPVDYYDLWLPPSADVVNEPRPATVLRRFRTVASLKGERNQYDKPLYSPSVLDKLVPMTFEEIIGSIDHGGGRVASDRMFPMSSARESGLRYVPIYIIYLPYIKFDDDGSEFFDTYFHLAINAAGSKPVILYHEPCPTDTRRTQLLVDDCVDWFTPWQSGGIGLVEKQLSKYNQKSLLQLLMVTAAVASVFPASIVQSDVWRDDEFISYRPGAHNFVEENPLGLDVIKPIPTMERGVMMTEQLLRFYADDMRSSFGLDGLTSDNPARSLGKNKTATEVNADQQGGNSFLQHQAENDSETLTDLCMAIFEVSQQCLMPDREGALQYESYTNSKVQELMISITDFRIPRSIQVLGPSHVTNPDQQLSNAIQAMKIATDAARAFPPAALFAEKAFMQVWQKLGMEIPPEYEAIKQQMMAQMQAAGPLGMMSPPPGPPGGPSAEALPDAQGAQPPNTNVPG